jgi:hypothetical protein
MERLPEVLVRKSKARRKGTVLDRLKAEEAQDALRRLLEAHPDLRIEAEEIARSLLREVDFEAVADEVEEAVGSFDIEDLNGRAGRHEWGYVEPTEAAWEILEEAVAPFVEDMNRQIELGLEPEALEICKGVVLGLYRAEHGKKGELAEWAPDFPAEAAGNAVRTWLTGDLLGKTPRRKGLAFPPEFVERFVPEWRERIGCLVSRRR